MLRGRVCASWLIGPWRGWTWSVRASKRGPNVHAGSLGRESPACPSLRPRQIHSPHPAPGELIAHREVVMSSRILPLLAAVALALTATPSHAQKAAKLTWGPAPPFLPAGAKFALVSGDPAKAGPYEIELNMPSGYVIPPHWHPTDETVSVKSGHFAYGMGDKMNAKGEKTMNAGQS